MLMRHPTIAAAAAAAASILLLMIAADGQAATTTPPSPPPAAIGNYCKPRERDALLAFKEGVTDDPAGLLASWRRGGGQLQEDCCQWRGVRCSNRTGHVVKLRLRNDHAGTALAGEIGQSLISLEHLRYLDLSMNNLAGSTGHVPEFLGSFRSLRYLNLSGIVFSGMVPPQLGNLSNLRYLDLSRIRLSGMVPFLYINDGSCSTSLYGDIPQALGNMLSLQVLDFSFDDHKDSMGMSVSKNGKMGTMKANLKNLCNLEVLDLDCRLEYGNIMDIFQSLPQCSPSKLKEVHLAGNSLTGMLPNWIGRLTSLVTLDLFNNSITGQVPSEIGMLTNLRNLYLHFNNMSGTITEKHFAHLTSLKSIYLCYNHLKIVMDPQWLPPFKLEKAYFASITMGPSFPRWLQSQVDIVALAMNDAGINDTFPDWFSTTFSKAKLLEFPGIPSGTQLGTLYDQNHHLYDGNDGLCGPPLQKSCYKSDASEQGHLMRSKQGFDIEPFSIGVVMGFMAGLWIVFYALLFRKSWRVAYFCLLDKVYDESSVLNVVEQLQYLKKDENRTSRAGAEVLRCKLHQLFWAYILP
ncbi:hypothetical protein OsI_36498 [Oryza sativa Indica Group]|uniref:Uncharacterized protein n=1 Tax=Oryza sativa subsp. indica TaxID=39946 RepID=B8BL27_ORYSI|nr:hypothetical protein OsI_36498 [Oryza sativa Indica Group]